MVSVKLLVSLAVILVGLVGTYYALHGEIKHLADTKAEKSVVSEMKERLIRIEVKLDLALQESTSRETK